MLSGWDNISPEVWILGVHLHPVGEYKIPFWEEWRPGEIPPFEVWDFDMIVWMLHHEPVAVS